MAFYELKEWGTGLLFDADNASEFFSQIKAYAESIKEDEGMDTDAFWDAFWGGSYYVYVDGMEYTPDDFVTGMYWAYWVMGDEGVLSGGYRPSGVEKLDSLYLDSGYTDARHIFESILAQDYNTSVENEEVVDAFSNPSVLGTAVVEEDIRNIMHDADLFVDITVRGGEIMVYYGDNKELRDDIMMALISEGYNPTYNDWNVIVEVDL